MSTPPDIDTCAIFRSLRDRWYAMHAGKGPEDLAAAMEAELGRSVSRARISVWATGSERKAPWDVIRWLLARTGMELVVPPVGDPYLTTRAA